MLRNQRSEIENRGSAFADGAGARRLQLAQSPTPSALAAGPAQVCVRRCRAWIDLFAPLATTSRSTH
jgi:hypothetical protein